jgi:excisionase family DNA binding protein
MTLASAAELKMTNLVVDRWLSVDEIAAYLGIKRDTVYKWIDRKRMPAHKVGSLWKFKQEEIDDWVRTGEAGEANRKRKSR